MVKCLAQAADPPVQPQLAHDAQNVHFPEGLQLLAADAGGDEAAGPADPCAGSRGPGRGRGGHSGPVGGQKGSRGASTGWGEATEASASLTGLTLKPVQVALGSCGRFEELSPAQWGTAASRCQGPRWAG